MINLNVNNQKVIVKPDYQPKTVTGSTYYNIVGSGATIVTETQHGNVVDINIYSTPPTGFTASWGSIVGNIALQSDLQQEFNTKVNLSTYTGYTVHTTQQINYISGVTSSNTSGITALQNSKLNKTTFSTYTGTTAPNTYANKINFNQHTGNTAIHRTSGDTQSQINHSLLGYYTTGQTNILLGAKLNKTTFSTYTGTTAPGQFLSINALNGYWTSAQTTSWVNGRGFLTSASLNGYWTSAQTSTFVTTRGYITSSALTPYWTSAQTQSHINSALLPYWTSAQTSTYVTTRGYVTASIINGIWNSGQTISYINGRNFLTGVTWSQVTGKPSFNYLPLSGGSLSGMLYGTSANFSGDLTVQGTMHTVHTEQIYSTKDYIFLRSGNTQSLGVGMLSGIGVLKADGTHTVVLGADKDAVMRVGWSGGTYVALAGREDTPHNGWYAKWDSGTTKFDTVDLDTTINAKLNTTTFNTFTGTTLPNNYLGIHALNGYWTSAQTSTYVTTRGYVTSSIINGIWNSGQTVSYINGRNFLTGVTWSQVSAKPTWTGSGETVVQLVGNTYRIYSPTFSTPNWSTLTGRPAWLTGTTLSAFEGAHAHSQYLTGVTWGMVSAKPTWVGSGQTSVTLVGSQYRIYTPVDTDTYLTTTAFSTYTGTTAPNAFASKTFLSTYTGTTAPGAFASKTFLSTYTGTTAPATYATKANAITGSTSLGGVTQVSTNSANKVRIKGLSGGTNITITTGATVNTIVATADSNKLNTTTFSTYTGTTAPGAFASKTFLSTYTGTTAPAAFAPKHSTITGVTSVVTLTSAQDNGIVQANGTFTITLPNSMPTGYYVDIINIGSGTITIAASGTLYSAGTKLATQYTGCSCYHSGSNVWYAVGLLTT